MRTPRSRRALLLSALPVSMALTGCFEGQLTGADEIPESGVVPADAYDCADIDRPEPLTPTHPDALEPAAYPAAPNPLLDEAGQYARDFEEAYRKNAFLEEYGSETRKYDFEFGARRTDEVEPDSDRDAILVSIVYDLSTKTRRSPKSPEYDTRVTYYVDDTVVLRARYNGGLADGPSFDPNPRTAGKPVECFE